MSMSRRNSLIAAAVALAVVAGAGWFAHGAWQKRRLDAQVAQLVGEAGGRLAATIGADLNAPPADLVPTLESSIKDTRAALEQLRAANARPDRALVEAADDYLLTVLEVLRQQAGSARGRLKFTESRKALAAHLAQAGQRSGNWMPEAIALRQQMDKDFFDYQMAASSLGNLLKGYPDSFKKIASRVPGASLPSDGAAKEAQARALEALDAARQEFEKAKQLVAPG
ncbi:MAG TPA: hypothetical protein VN747_03915 [Burkholderiales bacterium]|nr:hypothetical protein [Burkholderiales bacterium]